MKKILFALIIGFLMPTSLRAQENIQFADALVKQLCVQNWDTNGDGELSTDEAAAVTDMGRVFTYNWNVKTFNEFRYFTGVTRIGGDAFHMCGLTSIDLPANVKEIGGMAFNETDLTSTDGGVTEGVIVIPEGVTTLEWEAFACNPGFTSARIPASVTTIEASCFRSCANLATFVVDPENTVYRAYDDVLYEGNTGLVAYPSPKSGSCVIPEGVETVFAYAFYNVSINELTLPSTLKTMGGEWFIQGDLQRIFSGAPNPPQIEEYTFQEYNYENTTLYVPRGTKAAYQSAEIWSRFQNIEEFGEPVQAEPEPYAVLSDSNTVLTFYYDDQKAVRGGMSVGPFESRDTRGWHGETTNISNVVFDSSFANTSVTSTAYWFAGCSQLTSIAGLQYLNTSHVTDMRCMFTSCGMTSLDLSSFNTEDVERMDGMFGGCMELKSINLSSFNTSNVTSMSGMFELCMALNTLDLSSFNTARVTNMTEMFRECFALNTIYVGNDWSTNAIVYSIGMFSSCGSIVGGMGTKYNYNNLGADFAHIDGGVNNPGYLTSRDAIATFDGLTATVANSILDKAFANVGGRAVAAQTIAAIVWGNDFPLTADMLEGITNPNLLIYVNNAAYAPEGFNNIIVNGVAQNIILTDVAEGNGNFYCPQAFTAENISYTRNFTQTTKVGVSRGWESIALPFDVQSIVHETKGAIVPFGSADGGYNFWLRRMGNNGLEQATRIEANRGYVISMPNSNEYPEEYLLNGVVRFSAQQTIVPVTQPTAAEYTVADESVTLIPVFRRVAASDSIYALNVGEARGGYPEGSVFERALRDVRPFEAYTTHRAVGATRARYFSLKSLGADNSLFTAIKNITRDDSDNETVKVYNLSGVLLREGRRNETMRNLPKGIYIIGGQRVIVSQ